MHLGVIPFCPAIAPKNGQSRSKIGSIVPLGRGYFSHDSRHFVPGYDRTGPSGTFGNTFSNYSEMR
jgi:hypothetical protein